MTYATFELTVEDKLARLTLNQPELGNPFNAEACREFVDVASDLVHAPTCARCCSAGAAVSSASAAT